MSLLLSTVIHWKAYKLLWGEEGKEERRNELLLGGAGTRDEDLRQEQNALH